MFLLVLRFIAMTYKMGNVTNFLFYSVMEQRGRYRLIQSVLAACGSGPDLEATNTRGANQMDPAQFKAEDRLHGRRRKTSRLKRSFWTCFRQCTKWDQKLLTPFCMKLVCRHSISTSECHNDTP